MRALKYPLALAISLTASMILATATFADDWSDCNADNDADRMIRGCTALLLGSERSADAEQRAKLYFRRAAGYRDKEKYDSAIRDFDESIELNPSYSYSYYMRGNVYSSKGNPDRAIADYNKAIAMKNDVDDFYVGRAGAYLQKEDFVRAKDDVERALNLNSRNALAHVKRGLVHIGFREFSPAIAEWQLALKIEPIGLAADRANELLKNLAVVQKSLSDKKTNPFKSFQNADFVAPLVDKFKVANRGECELACAMEDKRCKSYSFNVWNSLCILKEEPSLLVLEPSTVSGIWRGKAKLPPKSTTPVGMARYRGKSFPGKSFSTDAAANFETCESRCNSDDKCVAFSFAKLGSSCKLFDIANEYSSKDGVDSGVKRQTSN